MPLSTPVWICLLVTCIMVWCQPVQIYKDRPSKKISEKNPWKVVFQIKGTTGTSKFDYPQSPENELMQITVYAQLGTIMREYSTVVPDGDRFEVTFLPPFTKPLATEIWTVCEINNFMQYAWNQNWDIQVRYGSKTGYYLMYVDPNPAAAGKPKYVELSDYTKAEGLTDISKSMTRFTKEKAARKKAEMMEKLAKLAPKASLSAMSAELCTKDDEKKAKQEYQSVYDDQVDEYGYYDGGYEEELENMMEWMYLKGYKNGIKRLLNKYNRH